MLLHSAILLSSPSHSEPAVYDEYAIKAAFLYNLSKFVNWPDETNSEPEAFQICVYGLDPYGQKIDAVASKTTRGRPIAITRYGKLRSGSCQIAFIGQSQTYKVEEAISFFRGKPVLTVGESAEFVDMGGIIGLVENENKIGVEINLKAAKAAELDLSAQLLRVANRVLDQ